MTNLFKRFFTHKSKFLLIILCLLGMIFSYSCSCRNEATRPPVITDDTNKQPEPTVFSVSQDTDNSSLKLIKTTSGYNSQIKIKFKANADFTADYEVSDTANKITKANIKSYDKSTGLITFDDATLNALTETPQNIKINFTITTTKKLESPEQKFNDIDLTLQKASSIEVGNTVKNLLIADDLQPGGAFTFNTARADTSVKDTIKMQNSHNSTANGDLLSLKNFKKSIIKVLEADSKIDRAYFSEEEPVNLGNTAISLTLYVVFAPEYDAGGTYEYTIEATAKSKTTNEGEWNLLQ